MSSWTQSKDLPSPRLTEEVDYLKLCEETAHALKNLIPTRGTHLLNRRQCQDLSGKILETVKNSREIVFRTGASPGLFNTALEYLYLHLEKARLLVSRCAARDWCEAAVFQIQNENAFREILIGIGLCYNVIYEQASSCCSTTHLEDLRNSSTFLPATDSDVHGDEEELQRWLENLVKKPSSVIHTAEGRSKAAKRALQQCLARYLLVKMKFRSEQSKTNSFDECRTILWTKEPDLPEAWANSDFIGSGSGGSGVCSTEWLGIRCAKKLFHYRDNEPIFTKEAAILAGLQHPRIVTFISCGNGEQRGDCFIAMELMEKSLFDLIEEQVRNGKEHFSLLVVVDMMVQMARGMLYLHDKGVAHRDLKPQNVVVKRLTFPHLHAKYYCVKLVDFGMSKTKIEVSKYNTISNPGIGTIRYRAPEVHPKAHHTSADGPKIDWFKVDTYSFSITCAHLLTLEEPFIDVTNLYSRLSSGERPELPRKYCPEELVSLLTACWDANPRSRPRFGEIFTRLEKFHHKLLRRSTLGDEGSRKKRTIVTRGFEFITRMMKQQCTVNKDDICYDSTDDNAAQGEVGGISTIEDLYETCIAEKLEAEIAGDEVVSTITCTSNHALVLLTESAYSENFICNICRKGGTGGVYHCNTCDFDAHPDCAVVKKKVTVTFRQALLHLELQIYRNNNPDHAAACGICQEPLEDREWVYKSTRSFYAHVLCTKYPAEMSHLLFQDHSLTLAESPTGKLCTCCYGSIKGYYYTCVTCAPQQCSIDLHPFCAILPAAPYCMNGKHHLSLVTNKSRFQCEKCQSTSRFASWHYHCEHCGVDKCLDCSGNTEEGDLDWNLAFEKFTSKNYAEAGVLVWDNIKANMISKLVDGLSIRDSSAPAAMKISPKVKAKSRSPRHEAKLKNVEELEIFLQNLQQHNDSKLSPADLEFLAASLEKLHLYRAKVLSLF